jgi:hypothetical protein
MPYLCAYQRVLEYLTLITERGGQAFGEEAFGEGWPGPRFRSP